MIRTGFWGYIILYHSIVIIRTPPPKKKKKIYIYIYIYIIYKQVNSIEALIVGFRGNGVFAGFTLGLWL